MTESSHLTSFDDDDGKKSIKDFRELYSSAEEFAREVSEFMSEISIPAYNELRYAGYHLSKSINDCGVLSNQEELRRALSHCERAQYEASESGIITALEIIKSFKEDYRNLVVKEIVEDYPNILRRADEATKIIVSGRGDNKTHPQRAAHYMKIFRELKNDSETLEYNRDDLNAMLRRERIKTRRFITRTLITVLGITVGTVVSLYLY